MRSLKRKVLVPLIAIGSAVALVTLWGIHEAAHRQLLEELDQRSELIANSVKQAADTSSDAAELQRLVTALGAHEEVRLILVTGGSPPQVVATTRPGWLGMAVDDLPPESLPDDFVNAGASQEARQHLGAGAFSTTRTLEGGAGTTGDPVVMVSLDPRPTYLEIRRFVTRMSLGLLAVLAALAAVGFWLLSQHVLVPVRSLRKFIEHRQDDGERYWSKAATHDELGLLARTLRDSLERTDAALNDLKNYKTALDAHGIVSVIDLHGRITHANDHLCEISGYSREELLGESSRIFYSGHHPKEFFSEMWSTISEGGVWDGEICDRAKDGTLYWTTTTLVPMVGPDGVARQFIGIAKDITERKRMEQELACERDLLRNLLEHFPDVIYFKDLHSRFTRVGRAYGERLGLDDINELVGKTDAHLFTEEHARAAFEDEQRIIRTGEPVLNRVEKEEWKGEAGRITWALSTKLALRDKDGTIIGTFGISKDITAIKEAELELEQVNRRMLEAHQELKASEQRFRTLSATAPVGIFEADREGIWTYVNSWWEVISGRTLDEAADDGWRRMVHPEDESRVYAGWRAAIDAAGEFDSEFRYRRPSGEIRWVHARSVPIRSEEGELAGFVGTVKDITAQKLVENELRASETRFRSVTQSCHDAIISVDGDGKIVFWNRGATTTFGHREEEIVGKHLEALVPERFRQLCRDGLADVRAGDERGLLGKTIEFTGLRMDGSEFPGDFSLSTWSSDEGVFYTGIVRDITSRKRTERALLEAKEEAEQASRTKSDFLANMSHEIRTPMNGILGMTGLALETELTREQREYLTMTRSSAESLLRLINDILDFSKIEAGKLELETIGFSLRDCIGDTLKPLGLRADQKGVELTARIPPEVPDQVLGDPMRLRQILVNLTENAIKFTPEGDVMVRVSMDAPADNGHEPMFHFSVSDTGIGIPAEKQALIFEAFSQADGTTTRHFGGTGLGLAISSELVRKMKGEIWVESEVGRGTTFHFTARLSIQDEGAESAVETGPNLEGMRVLVVDDHRESRQIVGEMLANWRLAPVLAADGEHALEEMKRAADEGRPFGLVIIDGVMPEMDGFALVERVRRESALGGAIVMVLAPAMPAGVGQRCHDLGIAAMVTKPVAQSELLDAILVAVDGGKTSPASKSPAPSAPDSAAGLRILLAEDNVINRAVVTGMLEKDGHVLIHATNGREAVEIASSDPEIDVILMDVQMPEMDGLEATRRIRGLEQAGARHIPIVAMTAHAMAGDRERCLEAGVDEYLAKPVRKESLLNVLAGISGTGGVSSATAEDPSAAFTRASLLAKFDENEELVSHLAGLFMENTPRLMDDLREAIAAGDPPALYRTAHALLSSLGAFGADEAHRIARELEELGRSGSVSGAEKLFAALEGEVATIYRALKPD